MGERCQTEVIATACFSVRNPPERPSSSHCRQSGSSFCNRLVEINFLISSFRKVLVLDFHWSQSVCIKIQKCRFSTLLSFGHGVYTILWSRVVVFNKTGSQLVKGEGCEKSIKNWVYIRDNKQTGTAYQRTGKQTFLSISAGTHPTNWRPHT